MTTVTTAVETALLADDHEYCHLFQLFLNGVTFYLTEAGHDIEYDGNTYLGNGQILDIDEIKETADLRVNEVGITFSLADQSILALLLGNNQIDRDVFVLRAFTNNGVVIPDPVMLFFGKVSGFNTDTTLEDSELQVKVSGPYADWQTTAGRRTTEAGQQRVFPNDRGMEFANQVREELRWGGE